MYFLNFVFFRKNEFGDFEPEFGEKLKKTYACEAFFDTKNTLCTHILLPKSPNSGSKSPNSFFSKKQRNLKTQGLSLEI